jgi:hypothetical protein
MPPVECVIEVEGNPYVIVYTSNAIFRLEERLGQPIMVVASRLMGNDAGFRELQAILWAGLEGARLRRKAPRVPWTMDEVGDLIDAGGGPAVFWPRWAKSIGEALAWAMPKPEPKKEPEQEPADPQ